MIFKDDVKSDNLKMIVIILYNLFIDKQHSEIMDANFIEKMFQLYKSLVDGDDLKR